MKKIKLLSIAFAFGIFFLGISTYAATFTVDKGYTYMGGKWGDWTITNIEFVNPEVGAQLQIGSGACGRNGIGCSTLYTATSSGAVNISIPKPNGYYFSGEGQWMNLTPGTDTGAIITYTESNSDIQGSVFNVIGDSISENTNLALIIASSLFALLFIIYLGKRFITGR